MTQQKTLVKKEQNQQVAKRNPIGELSQFLEGRKLEIQKVLPAGLSVERVIKTAIMAAMENPDIGNKCTPLSIYRSVVQASLMGLTVGGGFNEGYFIRYGNSCTFRASYLGWSKVAIRSEGIDLIRASVVYANDELEISEQPPMVHHRPRWVNGSRGDVVGVVACAYTLTTHNGKRTHELYDMTFVPPEDLAAAQAQAGNSSAWSKWPNEMRKKVAIRRLCKLLPRNDELNQLTKIENNADNGVVDVPDPIALPESDNLNEMIVDSRFEEEPVKELPEPEVVPPPAKKETKTSKLKGKLTKTKKDDAPQAPPDDTIPDYGPPDVDF